MSTNVIKSFRGKYEFLSNFYPVFVEYEGVRYPSVESAFQAAKSKDPDIRKWFLCCSGPSHAKKIGRKVKLREDWEDIKVDVMYELIRNKFKNLSLKKLLLETEDAELIEGNNHGDKFWGMVNGEGKNMLGKILMDVREELKYEDISK